MQSRVLAAVLVALAFRCAAQAPVPADLGASVQKQLPGLTETYKHLHRNPELSHHEEQTSASSSLASCASWATR